MKYYPILLSKAGELTALKNLSQNVKCEITPVIDVIFETLFKNLPKKGIQKEKFEEFVLKNWSFNGNQILLDFHLFEEIDKKLNIIEKLLTNLLNNGINVIPIIRKNSTSLYINLIKKIITTHRIKVCIRMSHHVGDFVYCSEGINNILNSIGQTKQDTLLLFDLGFIEERKYKELTNNVKDIISNLRDINEWSEIIVASGSFPEILMGMSGGNIYSILRCENNAWDLLNEGPSLGRKIKYADFGTKHPYYIPKEFQGTSSIKYTSAEKYYIYRGNKPANHPRGNRQYIDKAKVLVNEPYYLGSDFSWGDEQISLKATSEEQPGNATTWVAISQNHHITLLHSFL